MNRVTRILVTRKEECIINLLLVTAFNSVVNIERKIAISLSMC